MHSGDVTISVLRLQGAIMARGELCRSSLSLASIAYLIEKIFAIHRLAVAISINSPSGSLVQALLIYKRISNLTAEKSKQVLVFVEDFAASDGYMIVLHDRHCLVTRSSSIPTSIGIISSSFGFTELMKKIRCHTPHIHGRRERGDARSEQTRSEQTGKVIEHQTIEETAARNPRDLHRHA